MYTMKTKENYHRLLLSQYAKLESERFDNIFEMIIIQTELEIYRSNFKKKIVGDNVSYRQIKKKIKKLYEQLGQIEFDIYCLEDDMNDNIMKQYELGLVSEDAFKKVEEIKYCTFEEVMPPLSIEELKKYREIITKFNYSNYRTYIEEDIKVKKLENGKLGYYPSINI